MQFINEWGIPLTLNDEMGLLLEAVSPDDAILMWPVEIMGVTHQDDGTEIHITLNWGKWNGTPDELRATLSGLLVGQKTQLPPFSAWSATEFQGRDQVFKVLQIPGLKDFVIQLRKLVSSVFPDNFGPSYMPHITVPTSVWQTVSENKLTPREAKVKVGKLELRLGNKVLEQLEEARFILPKSQKMVLKDMLENKRRWKAFPGGFYAPEDEERSRVQERLFSAYVLYPVIRSLLRKGLIGQKIENNMTFFYPTPEGHRALGYLI